MSEIRKSSKLLRPLNIEEKCASLRHRLAYYLLLQVYTFMQTSGANGLPEAMTRLVEKAADMNVEEANRHPRERQPEVLGSELARHMGETFSSEYHVEEDEGKFKVALDRCGCIGALIEHSKSFGFSDVECRAIFCNACMGGYRQAAEKLDLKFEGTLTRNGCYMDFRNP